MLVRDIMTYNAETIDTGANLREAAKKMKNYDIGALPICEGDELVGMITDRDITIRAVAEGKDPFTTRVTEVMTPDVFYCLEDEEIQEAAKIMEEKAIHRLLVLNSDYEPIGFVSLSDFAVKSNDKQLTWEVLEKISEPASPNR